MPCRLLDSAICLLRREGPSNAARLLANTSAGTPLRELQETGCVAVSLEAVPAVKGTPKSKGAQNSEPGPRPHAAGFLGQAVPRALWPLPEEERHGRCLDSIRIERAEDSASRKRTQTER